MWLLILEALAALGLLLFFVWWTMFSGRRREAEPGHERVDEPPPPSPPSPPSGR